MASLFQRLKTKSTSQKPGLPHHEAREGSGFQLLLLGVFILHILTMNEAANLSAFNVINGLSTSVPAWLQATVTEMGNGVTLGAVILCYLVYRPELAGRVIAATILSLIAVPLLKQYFDAPRPAAVLEYLNIIGDIRMERSLPSGHASTIFLLVGLIFLSTQKCWLKLSVIALGTIVAASRIMVGAHWPEDVVLGAFVGLLCAYGAVNMVPLISMTDSVRSKVYIGLFAVIAFSEFKNGDDYPQFWQVQSVRWGIILLAAVLIGRYLLSQRQKLEV